MEVASPLAFQPVQTGAKRALGSCSPSRMDASNHAMVDVDAVAAEEALRSAKRRRFHCDQSIDNLSERFSSHSPFFANSLNPNKTMFSGAHAAASLKRMRGSTSSPVQNELKRVVDEQASVIETLKKDKTNLESTVANLKAENERTVKENHVLRRAVNIQQERQNHAEKEIKAAHDYRTDAEERIRKLEQLVHVLRYHLQAQQPSEVANDFMGMTPRNPDVY